MLSYPTFLHLLSRHAHYNSEAAKGIGHDPKPIRVRPFGKNFLILVENEPADFHEISAVQTGN